ncbi:aspartate-semialdehyde dehydrogenase [Oceanithermus desulfurans]|uniref:Aspartate-semialdehyde dehydrogenase n=2 Tax=Oceanithermus desulfurans TaxID=227924 RepID=A0A511RIE6_9DEIN|nr:aspartate-semialdehyde dehydrogenase [Oceanithermus desulfurans]MBB6030285.1 aspartate-semialdehyde dehydrogenase [Oceanithermus desulfurans]GEM89414.1 aspartate-semialdehyde dehydrogenase [Oceanithermus desulfurans NBRC 100063]
MRIAIVGATGAVGQELIQVLEERDFPVDELRLYASPRSAGKTLTFRGEAHTVEVTPEGPIPADVVLASAGGGVSKKLAPLWSGEGAVVVDNSSAWRYDPEVPLVIPEINPEAARAHKGIIANPNCTTAILAVALWPLHRAFGATHVVVSTYQATSGAGAEGMDELLRETRNYLDGKPVGHKVFQHPIPFNVIPHIDAFQDNGYTREEMKVVWETRKIFGEPEMKISSTAVRIPTLRAHSEAATVLFERPVTPEAARAVLEAAPGVEVVDDPERNRYPLPLTATGKWDVEVGRIRQNPAFDNALDFFVSGDQLLKGAALNAVQIAELLL